MERTEEQISEYENRPIGITQSKQQRGNKKKNWKKINKAQGPIEL